MRTPSLALVMAAAFVSAAFGQQAALPPRVASGYNTITETDLKADLTFVASDALQGRMSLQTGDDVAVQWIAANSLKPASSPPTATVICRPCRWSSFAAIATRATSR